MGSRCQVFDQAAVLRRNTAGGIESNTRTHKSRQVSKRTQQRRSSPRTRNNSHLAATSSTSWAKLPVKCSIRQVFDEAVKENVEFEQDKDVDKETPFEEIPFQRGGDIGLFYSFDLPTGPSRGEHILGAAVAQAIERFEIKQGEKLDREYELVRFEDSTDDDDWDVSDADGFELITQH
ncbi:hypothetical protein FQN57_007373 [Myotisia sp. PD_48]|nr:hypothetical protein FQN57_007373 [Myotisia sp. PD_48]